MKPRLLGLILVLLIPSLCLAGLGVFTLLRESKLQLSNYSVVAQKTARDIERWFRYAEATVSTKTEVCARLDFDEIQQVSQQLTAESEGIKRFMVFGEAVFEPSGSLPPLIDRVSVGEELEFEQNNPELALQAYLDRKSRSHPTTPRIPVLNQIARCYFKLRRWQDAIEVDGAIVEMQAVPDGDFSLQAAAYLRMGSAYLALKQYQPAESSLLSLYKGLAVGRWRGVGPFFRQQISELARELPNPITDVDFIEEIEAYHQHLERIRRQSIALTSSNSGQFHYIYDAGQRQFFGYAPFQTDRGRRIGWFEIKMSWLTSMLASNQREGSLITLAAEGEHLATTHQGRMQQGLRVASPVVAHVEIPAGFQVQVYPLNRSPIWGNTKAWLFGGAAFLLIIGLFVFWRELRLMNLQQEFINSVSHELRKPLNNLRYFLGSIEAQCTPDPSAFENWRWADGSLAQLQHMIENLLSLAGLREGNFSFDFQINYIDGLVESTVNAFQARAAEDGFVIKLSMPDLLPEVRFDAFALNLTLANLLDNALKYSRIRSDIPHRIIDVDVLPQDSWVVIVVSDPGIGISPHNQQEIFKRFYRERRDSSKPAGTGLGLTIAQAFVHAHGGRITVESQPMKGSTFSIWLPQAHQT